MTEMTTTENRATFARLTCNRQQPQHELEALRVFLRDVHCPCIARRPSIWEYRTEWLDPVRPDLLGPIAGVETDCPADQQIQFTSDVRWQDLQALADFNRSPNAAIRPLLVADVGMLIGLSNTYEVIGDNGWTFVDRTETSTPLGKVTHPTFALCLRASGELASFRHHVKAMCRRWADLDGVVRLRMNLFEIPNMATATHASVRPQPPEAQYQALIHLQVTRMEVTQSLFAGEVHPDGFLSAAHAYPVSHLFCWNYRGRPTLAGLRGFAAARSISAFDAQHHADVGMLEWMYGHIVAGGPEG